MKPYEKKLKNLLQNSVDSFDFAFERKNHADETVEIDTGVQVKGNPRFAATFNLVFLTKYFTLNGGAYTAVSAAADINAGLKNDLPFFIFGNNDFASAFKHLKGNFPINANWSYGRPGIYGKDSFSEFGFDSTVSGVLQQGDLVLPFTSALPGTGTTTLALNIVRCQEVAYGTLLGQLSSDRFNINGVRFVLVDATKLAQYNRQIGFFELSIFGKSKADKLTPNDYKSPEQFQNGIVDIPINGVWGAIDKHKSWGFYNLFDNVESNWTLFIANVNKLSA